MALANSTDGLWFNKTSSSTSALREFTHSRSLSNASNQTMMTFTSSSSGGTWYGLSFWCRQLMFRTDGTANHQSCNWMKGHVLWVGAGNYWETRMNDQYGYSNENTVLYSDISAGGSTITFRTHIFGGPGFSNRVIMNVFAMYYRWDLITISYA